MTHSQPATRAAAQGLRTSKLERRALDDVALQAGCTLLDPYACCEPCWRQWVCARLMEHLRGEHYWDELDRGDFALLRRDWLGNFELVRDVMARVAAGDDVMRVLGWAVAKQKPLDDVLDVLRTFDVEARDMSRFAWLSPAPPCGRA
jgi:hypothetical protein